MYRRHEASQLRKEFWTTFGHYMKPVPSAEGERINWLNYKTGEKHIFFRAGTGTESAFVAIEITHSDAGLQQLYFEQFCLLRTMLYHALQEEWSWELHTNDEHGKPVSRISKEISDVNILNKDDWPALISFFKPRLMALDAFWSTARYSFEGLR